MNSKIDKKELFIDMIQKEFPLKSRRVLEAVYDYPPTTFRINTHKISEQDVLKLLKREGFRIEIGPLPNSYVVRESPKDKKLSETKLVDEGKIYIQKLSSMIPVQMLDLQAEDKVLDMCAAPGSKTSQLALLSDDVSNIVAVDNNRRRFFKLRDNMKRQGFGNIEILNTTGVGLERRKPEYVNYFDKILIDAPCSNSGLICLSDKQSLEAWNPKASKGLAKLQKKLVSSGIAMLKPGGVLVYSTCTFSRLENEDLVIWTLQRFSNMSLMEQKKVVPDGIFTGFFAVKLLKLE